MELGTTRRAASKCRRQKRRERQCGRDRIWPNLIWPTQHLAKLHWPHLANFLWPNLANFVLSNVARRHLVNFFLVGCSLWGWDLGKGPEGVGA